MTSSNHSATQSAPMSRGANTGSVREGRDQSVRADVSRKFQGRLDGNFRGVPPQEIPAMEINTNDWNQTSARAINDWCAEESLETKEAAQILGLNHRTVENYRQGLCAPAGIPMLRCIAMIPQFAAAVDRLTAMERDCDPMTEKARTDLLLAAAKFLDAKGVRT